MAEKFVDKVVKIRNNIKGNNFEAINIYKRLIPILKVISNWNSLKLKTSTMNFRKLNPQMRVATMSWPQGY